MFNKSFMSANKRFSTRKIDTVVLNFAQLPIFTTPLLSINQDFNFN